MNRVAAPVVPPSQTTPSRSTASKYCSNFARSRPPSPSPNSLDHGLQLHIWVHLIFALEVHLQTRSIPASKCISELTWSSVSNCISKHARSRPPSASLSSLDVGLQAHLQTRSITASNCISEFTQSPSPSSSPHLLDPSLQVHLHTHSITASKYIF